MALTARNAAAIAWLLPLCAAALTLKTIAPVAIVQAQKQSGNSEQQKQLNAIGIDVLARRCYSMARAPVKGEPIDIPKNALHSSCVQGGGWYGFLAVLNDRPLVVEVYSEIQIKNILTTLKGK